MLIYCSSSRHHAALTSDGQDGGHPLYPQAEEGSDAPFGVIDREVVLVAPETFNRAMTVHLVCGRIIYAVS